MSVNVNSTSGLTTAAKYVGMWFTFKKMGIEGWRGIIPFYNMYVLFKKFLDVKSFVLYLVFRVCSIIGSVFGFIACYMGSIFLSFGVEHRYSRDIEALSSVGVIAMIIGFLIVICALALVAVSMVFEFKLYRRLSDAFGLGSGWAWGLLFVPYVFFMILGFSKDIVYCEVADTEADTQTDE